ncbi:MAG: ribonuclease PH [Chloroflexi bacterium]|nr:ribonuclease PH [Chloroflexota bacterium]
MTRPDGRTALEIRPVTMEPGFQTHAEGSVLIASGETRVLCAVSIEERVPGWLRGTGAGWVTAEYGMLPRSTNTRISRERASTGGRTQEIQRLIGRSLRAATNLDLLGARSFTVDCDVIHADGGTRTAAITGSYVALYLAMDQMVRDGQLSSIPLMAAVAATSVGMLNGGVLLDLCYEEDSAADVDANVVKLSTGDYVEVQGTAEGKPFSRERLGELLDAADSGIATLFEAQEAVIRAVVAERDASS